MTDLTTREKALVEAARRLTELYGTVTVDTFNSRIGAVMVALRAYDPARPKVYVLPSIGSMTVKERDAILAVFFGNEEQRIAAYNAIRELTAKEQE